MAEPPVADREPSRAATVQPVQPYRREQDASIDPSAPSVRAQVPADPGTTLVPSAARPRAAGLAGAEPDRQVMHPGFSSDRASEARRPLAPLPASGPLAASDNSVARTDKGPTAEFFRKPEALAHGKPPRLVLMSPPPPSDGPSGSSRASRACCRVVVPARAGWSGRPRRLNFHLSASPSTMQVRGSGFGEQRRVIPWRPGPSRPVVVPPTPHKVDRATAAKASPASCGPSTTPQSCVPQVLWRVFRQLVLFRAGRRRQPQYREHPPAVREGDPVTVERHLPDRQRQRQPRLVVLSVEPRVDWAGRRVRRAVRPAGAPRQVQSAVSATPQEVPLAAMVLAAMALGTARAMDPEATAAMALVASGVAATTMEVEVRRGAGAARTHNRAYPRRPWPGTSRGVTRHAPASHDASQYAAT